MDKLATADCLISLSEVARMPKYIWYVSQFIHEEWPVCGVFEFARVCSYLCVCVCMCDVCGDILAQPRGSGGTGG